MIVDKKYKIVLNEEDFDVILNCLREFAYKENEFINLPLAEEKAKKLLEKLEKRR